MPTPLTSLRIVFTGHKDHGKSTLIGFIRHGLRPGGDGPGEACAGMVYADVVDHLREERAGGLTLETAQTFVEAGARQYALIDVPGHRELIRNMLTGATQADAAVLVIAADEGLRFQTRRHVLLLSLLGFKSALVVINKMDLAGFSQARFDSLRAGAEKLLCANGIVPVATVPVSAAAGDNVLERSTRMPWYAAPPLFARITELALPVPPDSCGVRFPVQAVYRFDGETVVAGRLLTGKLGNGQTLTVYPGRQEVSVTGICRFPPDGRPAVAGESIGLTVDGSLPERGDVLACGSAPLHVTRRCRGRIVWLAEAPAAAGDKAVLRCATRVNEVVIREVEERFDSLRLRRIRDTGRLAQLDVGTVNLESRGRMVLEPFALTPGLGRFVLEQSGVCVAAGTVL